MRILIVTPACPHPFSDTAARWYFALVQELSRRGHDVRVLTTTEEPKRVIDESRELLSALPGRTPTVEIDTFTLSAPPWP